MIVNGWLGDHGAAILGARGDMRLDSTIESDCAPLHELVEILLAAAPGTRCLRDATRRGKCDGRGDGGSFARQPRGRDR